jgi:hypothetical protein
MLTQEAADMWRTILDRCHDDLDLNLPADRATFRYNVQDAVADVPLDVLGDVAALVGSTTTPITRSWILDAIVMNYVATATGRGTDVQVDAETHCSVCRAPYRIEPARAESLRIAHNVCTNDDCGHYTWVKGPDGLPVVEKPAPVKPVRYTWTPPWPEAWHERLARRIAPAGWYRDRAAPPLHTAIVDRVRLAWWSRGQQVERLARRIDPYVGPGALWTPPLRTAIENRALETVGSLLDSATDAVHTVRTDPRVHDTMATLSDLIDDGVLIARLDVLPWLRHRAALGAWQATNAACRGAARLRWAAARLENAVHELRHRADTAEAAAREAKDGRL